jgi:hypothetical protein
VFHKVLVFESLLSMSETFVCSVMALQLQTTSPRCSSAANFVCRDFNIFKIKNVSLSHFKITMSLSVCLTLILLSNSL